MHVHANGREKENLSQDRLQDQRQEPISCPSLPALIWLCLLHWTPGRDAGAGCIRLGIHLPGALTWCVPSAHLRISGSGRGPWGAPRPHLTCPVSPHRILVLSAARMRGGQPPSWGKRRNGLGPSYLEWGPKGGSEGPGALGPLEEWTARGHGGGTGRRVETTWPAGRTRAGNTCALLP